VPRIDWPTYHGAPSFTGVSTVAFPDSPALLWRVKAEAPVRQTPVAGSGCIFFANIHGKVFALDPQGKTVWTKDLFPPPTEKSVPSERIKAPLLYADNLVVAASGNGTIFALNAANGEEKWRYTVDGSIRAAANVGRVGDRAVLYFIESAEGILYGLGLQDGQLLWKTEGVGRCESPPAVLDGAIVFGSCASKLSVYATDTGKPLRSIETGEETELAGGVALDKGLVLAGSRGGQLVQADVATGEIRWKNNDSDVEAFTTPAVTPEMAVFADKDGIVYAIDRASGKTQWKFDTKGFSYSPVIVGDKVAVTADGELFLLRLKTGEKVWSFKLSDEATSPAVIGDLLVLGSEDGSVAAFGTPTPNAK
jgi:outer membrane protein assembly factor BamB